MRTKNPQKQRKLQRKNGFKKHNEVMIGRYVSGNGITKALQHFKEKKLKENTVQDWKKAYELSLLDKLKSTEPGKSVIVSIFYFEKQGRPPLLGTKLDLMLQEQIIIMGEQGKSIGSSTVIRIGRGTWKKQLA